MNTTGVILTILAIVGGIAWCIWAIREEKKAEAIRIEEAKKKKLLEEEILNNQNESL